MGNSIRKDCKILLFFIKTFKTFLLIKIYINGYFSA